MPGRKSYGQREYYNLKLRRGIIEGYWYLPDGTRLRRKLCTLEEAGFDELGQPKDISASGTKKRTAFLDALHREKERKILAGEKKRRIDGTKIGTLFQDYLDSMEGTHSPITINGYRLAFEKYKMASGNHPINELRKSHINRYYQHLKASGLADASIRTALTQLKTFCGWAHDFDEEEIEKRLDRIPAFPKVRVPEKLPQHLSDDELLMLRDHILAKWRAAKSEARVRLFWGHYRVLMLCAGTGFRRGEVFHLRWGDIDLINEEITVRMQTKWMVKERREKTIPIQPALLKFLTAERSENPNEHWFLDNGRGGRLWKHPNSLTDAFGAHLKSIGLGDKNVKAVHGFRTLFITTAYNKVGLDLGIIQNLAGHSQIKVTRSYVSKTDERQREAVKKFAEKETGIGALLEQEKKTSRKPLIN